MASFYMPLTPAPAAGASIPAAAAAGPIGAGVAVGQGIAKLIDLFAPPGLSPARKMSMFQEAATKAIKNLDEQYQAAKADGTLDANPWLLKSYQDQAKIWGDGLQQIAAQNGPAGQAGLRTMSWINNLPWSPEEGLLPTSTSSTPGTITATGSAGEGRLPSPGDPGQSTLSKILTTVGGALGVPSGASGGTTSTGAQLATLALKLGIPIGGALLSGFLANKQTPQETAALQQLIASAQASQAAGTKFLDASSAPINAASGFWQSILKGGPEATTALGPQIADTSAKYDNALASLRNTAPRSGAAEQEAADLPFQKIKATTDLYQNLYGQAPSNLASLGTNMASLGFTGLTGGRAGQTTLLDYAQQQRQNATSTGANVGRTLAQIVFAPKSTATNPLGA